MKVRMSKYWMCDVCAVRHGFICFKTGNTVSMGLCGWCDSDKEQWLTPLRDLKDGDGNRADDVVVQKTK